MKKLLVDLIFSILFGAALTMVSYWTYTQGQKSIKCSKVTVEAIKNDERG